MGVWQGKSRRKKTGGRRIYARSKRKHEIGPERQFTHVGATKAKSYRTRGGNTKVRLLEVESANVYVPKDKVTKKSRILTVKTNPANPNYVQRNILNKGATIETELGVARITSRPGQDGVVNARLVEN